MLFQSPIMKLMKTLKKLTLLILLTICGVSQLWAQRDIKLSLNKHNFVNNDTLMLDAAFWGFDDDPITGPVYLDIVSSADSVVISGELIKRADDLYSIAMKLPSNRIESYWDIFKICNQIQITDNDMYVNDVRALISIDGSIPERTGIMKRLQSVPLEKITYISFHPFTVSTYNSANRDKLCQLDIGTVQTYQPDNLFALQVTATTASGEVVAGIDAITLPVICVEPYFGDITVFTDDNFLQVKSMQPNRGRFAKYRDAHEAVHGYRLGRSRY